MLCSTWIRGTIGRQRAIQFDRHAFFSRKRKNTVQRESFAAHISVAAYNNARFALQAAALVAEETNAPDTFHTFFAGIDAGIDVACRLATSQAGS